MFTWELRALQEVMSARLRPALWVTCASWKPHLAARGTGTGNEWQSSCVSRPVMAGCRVFSTKALMFSLELQPEGTAGVAAFPS